MALKIIQVLNLILITQTLKIWKSGKLSLKKNVYFVLLVLFLSLFWK